MKGFYENPVNIMLNVSKRMKAFSKDLYCQTAFYLYRKAYGTHKKVTRIKKRIYKVCKIQHQHIKINDLSIHKIVNDQKVKLRKQCINNSIIKLNSVEII